MGNASGLNTGNPFVKNVPAYNRFQYNGTISGALSKKASFFFSVEQRDNHDQQVYDFQPSVLGSCDFGYGVYSAGRCSGAEANPHNHITVSPRIDLQLGEKNTLTVRYQFYYDTESGDINSTQLPSQSSSSSTTEHALQLSDSQIINERMVNETRFEYRRTTESDTPVSNLPTIRVSGNFTGGGASSQLSNDHQEHFELQNFTTMSVGRHAVKFGAWLRDNRDANTSTSNRNGTLIFSQTGYVDALSKLAAGQNLNSVGNDLVTLSVGAGRTNYAANVFDGALFVQDDWKVNPRFTLSGGIRWEGQNHIADHNDWAPRVATGLCTGRQRQQAGEDGGARGVRDLLRPRTNCERAGGDAAERELRPGGGDGDVACMSECYESHCRGLFRMPAGGTLRAHAEQHDCGDCAELSMRLYTHQFGGSLERQLTKTTTATVTYLHSFRRAPGSDARFECVSSAGGDDVLQQHNWAAAKSFAGDRATVFSRSGVQAGTADREHECVGFLRSSACSDSTISRSRTRDGAGGEVSNSYNLSQDYGRAGFVSRHQVFLMGNYTAPWNLRFNPFIVARSGRPYNVVTGEDLTGDNFINDRPGMVDSSQCTSTLTGQFVPTSFGCLDVTPGPGEKLLGNESWKQPCVSCRKSAAEPRVWDWPQGGGKRCRRSATGWWAGRRPSGRRTWRRPRWRIRSGRIWRWRRWWAARHVWSSGQRPQIQPEFQCAGFEPVQQH